MLSDSNSSPKKQLSFVWETVKDDKNSYRIGKSVEGNYLIRIESKIENFWSWNIHRNNEWIMDSNSYPSGNCMKESDAVSLAISIATGHYKNNTKLSWK